MPPLVFFTIISRNYLAYASTLMQSLAAQHPDSKRYLCLVDNRGDDSALETDLFETVTIDQLDLPNFDAFVFRYDIMELNTAVKPYMFEWLRMRHPRAGLVYLDPDIYVVQPLSEVAQAFAGGKLAVLTPHLNAPLPDDGKFPTELSLMRTGAYNCGFVSINAAHPQSAMLIDWWARKLEFDCFVDLESGLFTDQKWMDMAPGLFPDVSILRHDGYNVAYWNLVSRPVVQSADGIYETNGVPLVFAHFSGVDLSRPEIFSKHQNRLGAADLGGLRPLYEEYLQKLHDNNHAQHSRAPYAYGTFADGEKIAPVLRRSYRRYFDICCERPVPHPFQMDRERFNEACPELPEIPGLPISHVMYEIWRTQENLRDAFALRTFEGREAYIQWYLDAAAADMRLGETYVAAIRSQFRPTRNVKPGERGVRGRLGAAVLRVFAWGKRHSLLTNLYARIPFGWRLALRQRLHAAAGMPMPPLPFETAKRRAARIKRAPPSVGPGVNLLGYARGEFGVAENVRSYARALEQSGYPFLLFNFDVGTASRQQDRSMEGHLSDTLRYATNTFFINADQMPVARSVLGREAFAGRYNIGFWVWELEKFPNDWKGAFDLVDEVWVPTTFVRDAIAASTGKPVLRMPKAIEFQVPTGMDRPYFGLPADEFVFLFSYDFNGFASRKNPEAVIAAFRRAFADGAAGVRLLVKSTNGGRFRDRLDALQSSIADDPRIEVRDGFLSREEMFGLQNTIDCFVSLHRAEGFGLGMAECMYLGKPVIATSYSGNLDFMDRDNSLLVDCKMIPLRDGDYPYWRGQHWADPDVTHAARLMRQVYENRELARQIGAAAAKSLRRSNSRSVCAEAATARLAEIDRRRTAA
ncbi:MAG TPA: glycosyltransferase family 4 protein [Rhodanobacteraceae bacterium]|nr:glycosyltransferase family 4 protein [Rhodanobacteraceae bacterium]